MQHHEMLVAYGVGIYGQDGGRVLRSWTETKVFLPARSRILVTGGVDYEDHVRIRDTVGHGEHILQEEMARGVRTPWTSRGNKRRAMEHLEGELLTFAKLLPYVRIEGED